MTAKTFCLLLAIVSLFVSLDSATCGFAEEKPVEKPRIGAVIGEFQLRDYRGREWSLNDFADKQILVVAFIGTECPLVKLYAERLKELGEKFAERGVAVVGINSNQQDSITEIAHFARVNKIEFPLLKDVGNRVADQFGAQRTPEVFLLDAERRIQYHGAIDDEYHYGVQRAKATETYLYDAIESLLAAKPVKVAETEVIGCHIGRILEPKNDSPVTYCNQIARIFQQRCVSCHRKGEIAPFELADYDEVVGWAEMIEEVVRDQRMPPWTASPEHGKFKNDATLSAEEKQLIYDWVKNGAPKGDQKDLPEPVEFVEGWRIGEPDVVIEMSKRPFKVPATGEVPYQYFVVDPGFKEDKWVKAAECRPGNRAVVHHILVAIPGDRKRARAHGELNSQWLTAAAPGAEPLMLPDGYAKLIPAGSKLLFQMHYTPTGTPQEDLSKVGFVFADPETVKHEVLTQQAVNDGFRIPAGASNHRVVSSYLFKQDAELLSLFPHMHLRGKSFQYTAIYPDKSRDILLDVPKYDFNWQIGCQLAEPKQIPAGTRIECVAHFDNSLDNLANPDPTKAVQWGDQTWEEMMIGYFDIALEGTRDAKK